MQVFKTVVTGLTLVFLLAGTAFAQGQNQEDLYDQPQQRPQMPDVPSPEEISDDELTTFVEASDAIQPIQEQAQEDIEKVIVDEGMQLERFQEIMIAMQNPQLADQLDISQEEEMTLQAIHPQLMEIEVEATEEIRSEIADKGLDVQRYQAIFMSLQQHPELMDRLEDLMENRQ